MKKLLVAVGLGLALAAGAQAADSKVAVVNIQNIFQQVAKDSGVEKVLDNEFQGRASELQKMEADLRSKAQKLQKEGEKMKAADRSKLEKEAATEQQTFTTQVQQFDQDHTRRVNEERNKIIARIDTAVKKVAANEKIDVVLDSGTVLYKSAEVKDISSEVLKQVK